MDFHFLIIITISCFPVFLLRTPLYTNIHQHLCDSHMQGIFVRCAEGNGHSGKNSAIKSLSQSLIQTFHFFLSTSLKQAHQAGGLRTTTLPTSSFSTERSTFSFRSLRQSGFLLCFFLICTESLSLKMETTADSFPPGSYRYPMGYIE